MEWREEIGVGGEGFKTMLAMAGKYLVIQNVPRNIVLKIVVLHYGGNYYSFFQYIGPKRIIHFSFIFFTRKIEITL